MTSSPHPPRMIGALLALVSCSELPAQISTATRLEVVARNTVFYVDDATQYGNYATLQERTTPSQGGRNFRSWTAIGDIVSVNGQPAKGVLVNKAHVLGLSTNPANGQAIADVTRLALIHYVLEILQPDGKPVGSLMLQGMIFGATPPGAPSGSRLSNLAIVGGTGAFLGARGYSGLVGTSGATVGGASIAEDPGLRRSRPSDEWTLTMNLIPAFAPEIVTTPGGPAVVHSSDFTPVSASKPARAGEILSLFARHLGPTSPGVDPGQGFPATSLQEVTSPIQIMVNGSPVEVLAATGYPGSLDGYQVNFRLPPDVARGLASLRLSAAWVSAPEIKIPIE